MFGEWGVGFASGVSGGFLTDVYEVSTGQKIEPNHAMLYNAGNVTGIAVSFLVGMKAATWATTAAGPLKWVATVETGLDVYGAAKATANLAQSYLDNGKFEREDAWNLLDYVPFAGAILGSKKFFAANKAIKGSTESSDGLLKNSTRNVGTQFGNCFVAGTEILTTEGEKDIEDIQVGDWVIADDPTTPGEIEARQVLETFVRETDGLVDLYVDGEVISTTAEHPFWVPGAGWVEAKDLQVGSLLQTDEETFVDIDRIERREGKTTVYNFEIEGFSTYFVSDLGVLVHNTCGKFPNLFPEDVPNYEIRRNELFFDGQKWRYKTPQGNIYTPDGQYNFVVKDGKTYIAKYGGHIDISGGQDVDFAGQVRFGRHKNRGILKYWDNASGHYKPPADAAPNAIFPLDLFRTYNFE